jgi:hypothetical protein
MPTKSPEVSLVEEEELAAWWRLPAPQE